MTAYELQRLKYVRVVGLIDRLGYLYCTECRDLGSWYEHFVWDDQTAHVDECCDECGRVVGTVR